MSLHKIDYGYVGLLQSINSVKYAAQKWKTDFGDCQDAREPSTGSKGDFGIQCDGTGAGAHPRRGWIPNESKSEEFEADIRTDGLSTSKDVEEICA